jgi:hypothetical protein
MSLARELRRHAFDRIVEGGDLDGYVEQVEARLAATGPNPFADAATTRFDDDPAALAAWLEGARDDLSGRAGELGMLYVEMNGFDINPERWHADAFGFAMPVVSDGLLHERFWREVGDHAPSHALTGMEPMQAAFAHHLATGSDDLGAPAEMATRLVHGRFLQHVATAVAGLRAWPDELEIAVTAHDLDPTVRFRAGQLVVESRERRPLTAEDRRRVDGPIDPEGFYELLLLEGDRDVHPTVTTAEADLTTWLRLERAFRQDASDGEEATSIRLELTPTQELFEDVLPVLGRPILSDELVAALETIEPGGLVTLPVTVVAPRSGERRSYHLVRPSVTVPSEPGRRRRPRTIASRDAGGRHVLGLEDSSGRTIALVSGSALLQLSELGCHTGIEPRRVAVVDG